VRTRSSIDHEVDEKGKLVQELRRGHDQFFALASSDRDNKIGGPDAAAENNGKGHTVMKFHQAASFS